MTFTTDQKTELSKPLSASNVKPPAPGKYGDYIEGWKVIEEANRIFGFDGWTRETVSMIETNREKLTLQGRNNSTYEQWRVGYVAKVRVTVHGVIREGTGFGSGMAKPEALGEAIESAVKEAETDAMKRGLMTFGYPFGLALYDKTQANVTEDAPHKPSARPVETPKNFNSYLTSLTSAKTLGDAQAAFAIIWKSDLSSEDKVTLQAAYEAQKVRIATPDFSGLEA
jgi:DNA repair and recombination protein RAD52